jgi:(p)ppGpp synthase/HD superfamily hydrolase
MSVSDAVYDDALRIAAVVHAGQTWKGTSLPYLTHVVRVARHLEQAGAAAPVVLAGLLHDTLEDLEDSADLRVALRDIDPTFDAPPGDKGLLAAVTRLIDARVGVETRLLVEAVTSRAREDGEDVQARRARRRRQLDHLRVATDDVVRLKAADTWANVTEMAREVDARGIAGARLKAPVDELRWYYGEIVAIVGARLAPDDVLAVSLKVAFGKL